MTEDRLPKAAEEPSPANGAVKQRKKRKWDQPADSLMSGGMGVTGTMLSGVDGVYASVLPGVLPLSVPLHLNLATIAATSQSLQIPLIPPNTAAIVQKLSQPKIQDELIAREIVINDADPSVRYKLTKRQTQEEIQKSTGAVVITRGKYRPPNGLPDGEKPLYLHISAGAHLKDTVERIKAVDHAACMVEDMLKQCQSSLPASTVLPSVFSDGLATQSLNTCLYLGFEPDPSLNIAARIRGPNDQYINHIMNETGATVVLRGHGSENPDNSKTQQPLHLFLSSSNPTSLEDARILAENLLDTICAECGVSRISSSKTYNAVPPPQQLLAGLSSASSGSTCMPVVSMPMASLKPSGSSDSTTCSPIMVQPTPSQLNYHPSVSGGTSYSGYGGIYPQATPLQQVALALRQAPPNSSSAATTSQAMVSPKTNTSSCVEMDKRPPQKRKFQELPVSSVRPMIPKQNLQQESEFLKPGLEDSSSEGLFSMPPPKKLFPTRSGDMQPPLARTMPPPPATPPSRSMPPPPPKFSPAKDENRGSAVKRPGSELISITNSKNTENRNIEPVPDTLLKLMEYGEEEDDTDGAGE
ncbi:K Homology domain type 1 domain-containing protein [Dioscorea alata]|uniref:K Homology domain type 1 domain-containing protein n=1 Tax=Dioscorea alata TaxID=55571 RepID=A0ACB7UWC8_DIOAL|nr:K Homology domain type 1 domain-containing protein [Dioscorea alata]